MQFYQRWRDFISSVFYDYTEYEEGENLKEALDDSAEESGCCRG